jgi:hypothetical protein
VSGLSPLVDTLLATRLAQRVDLVPLKPEVQLAGPGAVTQVEEVINDVRLPSRAALEQQLGVGLLKGGLRGHGDRAARPDQGVTLSAAARAVSAILGGETGAAARVTGSRPLLASSQVPPSQAIAATLAHTVSHSGLFYESHLAQFAAGTRSLDELAQEPQARLEGSPKAPSLPPGLPEGPDSGQAMSPAGSRTAQPAALPASDAASGGSAKPAPILPGLPQALGQGDNWTIDTAGRPGAQAVAPQADEALPGGNMKPGAAASLPAADADAARHAPVLDAAHAHRNAYASMQEADGSRPVARSHDDSATNASRSSAPALAGIHQDAVALVRQQLELLAQPAFRWSGEAWPAVPMDWEIREEDRQAAAGDEASPRSWSTRLALMLPTLRDIEVRISLTGNALQVRLAAREDATRERLREARAELPARLGALGLEVTGLQIASLAAAAAPETPKAGDGA